MIPPIFIYDYIAHIYLQFIKKLFSFKIIINVIFIVALIIITPMIDTTTSINGTVLIVEIIILVLIHMCYICYMEYSVIFNVKYLTTIIICDAIYSCCVTSYYIHFVDRTLISIILSIVIFSNIVIFAIPFIFPLISFVLISLLFCCAKKKTMNIIFKRDHTRIMTYQEHGQNDLQCSICCSDMKNIDIIRVLQCNHYFHLMCIDEWLRDHNTCPLCRNNISEHNTSNVIV
jgi:hypothetical protein